MFSILNGIWHEPLLTFYKNKSTLVIIYFFKFTLFVNKLGLIHNNILFKYFLSVLGGGAER